jgi:peroxiredoxin
VIFLVLPISLAVGLAEVSSVGRMWAGRGPDPLWVRICGPKGTKWAGVHRISKIVTSSAKSLIEHVWTRQRSPMAHDPYSLPKNLPVPVDDGSCKHLQGARMPRVSLPSTHDRLVDVADASARAVFFFYPRTGRPGVPPPDGWDSIPGARGCTPESCSYRDRYSLFKGLGFEVFGVSSQTPEDQREFALRSGIPYEILSDSKLALTNLLRLPTFTVKEVATPLIKRLTIVTQDGVIKKVFYPVFPPDRNAEEVLGYLKSGA